jgi:hypothetical protein
MADKSLEENVQLPRAEQDRRQSKSESLPYLTEEGMIMVDRREGGDRRKKLFHAPDLVTILGNS